LLYSRKPSGRGCIAVAELPASREEWWACATRSGVGCVVRQLPVT